MTKLNLLNKNSIRLRIGEIKLQQARARKVYQAGGHVIAFDSDGEIEALEAILRVLDLPIYQLLHRDPHHAVREVRDALAGR